MSHQSDARPSSAPRIRRRTLLAWGGAAALAPAVARAQAVAGTGAATQAQARPMSVGFLEGSDAWLSYKSVTTGMIARGGRAGEETGGRHRVVSAAGLPVGDQAMANESAWLRIHGLYPIPNPTNVLRADLTVYFPSPEPGVPRLPFYAWSYKSRPAANVGAPVQFVVPLDVDSIRLVLDVVPRTDAAVTRRAIGLATEQPGGRFVADFTVDWFAGRPKLQRGVYLLGLAGNTWASARTLPIQQPRAPRPVELLSLLVSVDLAAGDEATK